jgi:signal peptidase II
VPTTTQDQPDAPPRTRRRALLIALFSISAVVLVLDQVSKAWAISSLVEGERQDLVGGLLGLQLVFNAGAALSIATGMTWVLTIVAAAVIVVVVRASRRIGSWAWAVALGLLLGGALGNLVDRLVRAPGIARGEVVDFIAYAQWFVGNVADIAIVVAAVLVVILAALGVHIDGTRDGHGDVEPDSETDDAAAVDAAADDEPESSTAPAAAPTATSATTEQNA